MTLRCPIALCAKINDEGAAACGECGTPLTGYARLLSHTGTLFNEGLARARAGQVGRARDLFAAVVEWCPGDVPARNALALACYQGGDWSEARRHWTRVLEIRPRDRFAADWLSELDRRHPMPDGTWTFEVEPRLDPGAGLTETELRESLLATTGASRVEPIRVGVPEPGRRPAEFIEVATFVLTALGTLTQVVDTCRKWVADRRRDGVRSVVITLDGDRLELPPTLTRAEEKAIEEFIRRHATENDEDGRTDRR